MIKLNKDRLACKLERAILKDEELTKEDLMKVRDILLIHEHEVFRRFAEEPATHPTRWDWLSGNVGE